MCTKGQRSRRRAIDRLKGRNTEGERGVKYLERQTDQRMENQRDGREDIARMIKRE